MKITITDKRKRYHKIYKIQKQIIIQPQEIFVLFFSLKIWNYEILQ